MLFLNLTDYSRAGISLHATKPISGELIASGSGGELVLEATSAGDLRVEGLVREDGAAGELHVKPGRNIFKVRWAVSGP